MTKSKPMLAYDSSEHLFESTGIRGPRREGCKINLPASRGLAADTQLAEDVLGRPASARPAPRRQTDAERAEYEAMFPHANRLGCA
ncbi:hypothetical protein [Methylobacterium sp. CM6246]